MKQSRVTSQFQWRKLIIPKRRYYLFWGGLMTVQCKQQFSERLAPDVLLLQLLHQPTVQVPVQMNGATVASWVRNYSFTPPRDDICFLFVWLLLLFAGQTTHLREQLTELRLDQTRSCWWAEHCKEISNIRALVQNNINKLLPHWRKNISHVKK